MQDTLNGATANLYLVFNEEQHGGSCGTRLLLEQLFVGIDAELLECLIGATEKRKCHSQDRGVTSCICIHAVCY